MRRINEKGLAIVREFEGLRLKAYECAAGVWTVGWGHTTTAKPGMTITLEEAEALLRSDLARFERGVEKALGDTPTSSNEYSAFVSLAFNIGIAGFERSTALKRHKAGKRISAANAILLWNKGGGRVLKGLMRRREAERALYLTPDAKQSEIPPAKAPETPVEAATAPKAREQSPTPVPVEPAPLGCLAAILAMFK